MIKDLTKSANSKPSSLKNYTNQQLDVFINQKVDGVNETKTTGTGNRIPIYKQGKQMESTPRNKDNSSYLNEKTIDTTMQRNQNSSQGKVQGHLYNFLKDSKGLKVSAEVPKRPTMKLSRPQSTKNIYTSSTNRKYPRAESAGTSFLRSKNFDQNKSSELVKSTNKSFEENVKALEFYINEIKLRGFEKVRREVEHKQRVIKQLQVEVDSLQKKVNFINSQKKHYGTKNSKFQCEMNMYKEISERCSRDIYFMYKEMPSIKSEIEEMNVEYGNRLKETKMIYTLINEEERDINSIKHEIRKLNKKKSDIEKEKESYRNGIALLKKHIAVVKDKIKNEDEKSRDFMLNVSSFVNKSIYD